MWIGRPPLTVSVAKILRKSWCERQRCAVDVDDAGPVGQAGQQFADVSWADDLTPVMEPGLEQVRHWRPEGPLVSVVADE